MTMSEHGAELSPKKVTVVLKEEVYARRSMPFFRRFSV